VVVAPIIFIAAQERLLADRAHDIYFKRVALISLMSIFFFSLVTHVGIELSYASYKPQSPQVETGRVNRITINHGSVVYVSQKELRRFKSVQTAALGAMLVSFIGIGILKLSVKDIWN
jgi:hypothetical protein